MRGCLIEMRTFFKSELSRWHQARENYEGLEKVERREIDGFLFPVRLEWNPSRERSTTAKVDSVSIAERKCFLCSSNRPQEQGRFDINGCHDYDVLVNPFPIFPIHFTIASKRHIHQDEIDLGVMADFALQNDEMVVFYNASRSGASAPDHLHYQAGNKDYLPICDYVEHMSEGEGITLYKSSPMKFLHIAKSVDKFDDFSIINRLGGGEIGECGDISMRNVLMWRGSNSLLNIIVIPRKAHRPKCYYAEGEGQMSVSPGAVDMAGVIILPRRKDFERISREDVRQVYTETGYTSAEIERWVIEMKIIVDRIY